MVPVRRRPASRARRPRRGRESWEKHAQNLMARRIKHDTAIVLHLQDSARMTIGAGGPDRDVARSPDHEVAVRLHYRNSAVVPCGVGISERHVARSPKDQVAVALHLEDELAVRRGDLGAAGDLPARVQLPGVGVAGVASGLSRTTFVCGPTIPSAGMMWCSC